MEWKETRTVHRAGPYRTAPRMIYLPISIFSLFRRQRAVYPPSTATCVPDHEACTGAAKPQAQQRQPPQTDQVDRWVVPFVMSFMVSGSLAIMSANHRCFDCTGAHGIDANASGGIFKRCALRQPESRRVSLRDRWPGPEMPMRPPNRRIVHDCPTSLACAFGAIRTSCRARHCGDWSHSLGRTLD